MNNTLKIILIVAGSMLVVSVLLGVGFVAGRFVFNSNGWWMPMHSFNQGGFFNQSGPFNNNPSVGPGMMQGYYDNNQDFDGECPYAEGFSWGRGMMGGWSGGMMGRWGQNGVYCGDFDDMGPGMMWDYDTQSQSNTDPITVDQARGAVNDFLDRYGDPNLVLAEVMIFDNQAYAEIIEADTGIGAMEVLIDPGTLNVYPEFGPNMMWNQKYSQMGHGMMGGFYRSGTSADQMSVSPEEAVQAAQAYLDRNEPGLQVADHADPFYGYYTLHTTKNDETVGMLSVNGYTGDVFLHTWHGNFLEMQSFED